MLTMKGGRVNCCFSAGQRAAKYIKINYNYTAALGKNYYPEFSRSFAD